MKSITAAAAVRHLRSLAILLICAAFYYALLPADPMVQAQSDAPVPEAIVFSESFNTSAPPALPLAWSTGQTGAGTNFTTVPATANNQTVSGFTSSPAAAGSSELVSPAVFVDSSPARISFRHIFITEPQVGFDGGVLEISIAGGPFQDVIAAGGQFVQGGYVQAIAPEAIGNPLIGRQAWTGVATDYRTTTLLLPASSAGQNVRFKWRYGTDQVLGGSGWWIDDVTIFTGSQGPGISYTFTNNAPINIPISGNGSPYPSVINVSNIPIQLAKVTVQLNAINHTFPSDIDILLVGPQGQTAVIMSDVGGSTDLVSTTVTLDDAALTPMTATGVITSGTYIPTNSGVGDIFPSPAPGATSSSTLAVFGETNPNGDWRLFVVDDVGSDGGSISLGWTLTLTAAISGQNNDTISIPDSGPASPYPSEITVADNSNLVSQVVVNLINFSHSSPDDVDILLASPSGRIVTLMSDVGGSNALTNVNLAFDDMAVGSMPDNGPIAPGSYRPTDFEPGDAFPAPAPAGAPHGRTLGSLNGTQPNGVWRLFIVDDTGNSVGNVSGGWSILVGTAPGVVTLQGTANGSPYPSEISVSGFPGNITKATVSLSNVSHVSPDDMDIMLVGPDNRRIVLMSDVGGGNEIGRANIVFDDNAPSQLPDSGPITSGSYRPTDFEPGESFPAPAPAGSPTGTTLNAFYGGLPNGIWKLYAVNDGGGYGSLAGTWSVTLETSTSACLHNISPNVQSFPVGGGSSSFAVVQPGGCAWTSNTTDSFITITSGASGGGNGAVGFTVAANQGPPRTGTITVSNGVTNRSFQIQQASGCPFSVGQSTVSFPATGGPGSVIVSAGGGCSWEGTTSAGWIQVTSPPQNGAGTLTFNVQPNTTRIARSGTINVGTHIVNVNQAGVRSPLFDFDGDARTDVSIYRPSTSTWWIAPSGQPGTAAATQFGIASDRIAPADFDGDRKTDIAVYRDGVWYVLRSSDGTAAVVGWGTTTDKPLPADYDGDGSAEYAIYRAASGTWWVRYSNGTHTAVAFGTPTDVPTPGDYDGDGKTDVSVYRGAAAAGEQGTWWIFRSSDSVIAMMSFGILGDVAVPADYDGDGRENIALYRPSTAFWYRSTDPATNYDGVQWGLPGDKPVPGDYDGDGKADPGVVRSGSNVVWHMLRSTSGAVSITFGAADDRPAPSAFIP